MKVTVTKAFRKTVRMEFLKDHLLLTVPMWMTQEDIYAFLDKHQRRINNTNAKIIENESREKCPPMTPEELNKLADQALSDIPPRVEKYARAMGVTYGNITIRAQKKRWGSCSENGNLSFNAALMLMPEDVRDSIIVHELTHRKQPGHSADFYREVERAFPGYRDCAHAFVQSPVGL